MAVSGRFTHSMVVTADGSVGRRVFSGGSDEDADGRLGHGSDFTRQKIPKQIAALADRRVVTADVGWTQSLMVAICDVREGL